MVYDDLLEGPKSSEPSEIELERERHRKRYVEMQLRIRSMEGPWLGIVWSAAPGRSPKPRPARRECAEHVLGGIRGCSPVAAPCLLGSAVGDPGTMRSALLPNAARAEKFGTEFVDPSQRREYRDVARKERLQRPGFVTGIDVFSEVRRGAE